MTLVEKLKAFAAICEAHDRGKPIEVRRIAGTEKWSKVEASVVLSERDAAIFLQGEWDYRIAPKPEPKMPKGLFWVRYSGNILVERLVVCVDNERSMLGLGRFGGTPEHTSQSLAFRSAYKGWHWSADRETWFTFTGEKVP